MEEKQKYLSKEEVQDVIDFANGLYAVERFGIGAYSPWMSNANLNNLNNNAKVPTSKKIKEALSAYKENAGDLQDYVQFLTMYDMLFKRTLYAYVNTLSFDMTIHCTNAYTQVDFESDSYAKDKMKFYDFLNKFDYKAEFRKVLEQVMTSEVYYTWFRKTKWGNKGMKCTLQMLPQKNCMLTNYWEKGLLFDFDMGYFLQPGVDIDGFDPVFKKYYNRVFAPNGVVGEYIPSAVLNNRTGTYAYWTQTSPEEGAWAWKFNMSNFNATPFLAPFLKESIHNEEVEQLQYNKDIASAYGILAGEIQLFDNAKSGTVADQFAINPSTLGKFMGMVKSGLGDTVKAVAMPVKNIDFYQYEDKNTDMYSDTLTEAAGVGSSISRVIYSTDKMSNAEIEAGQTEMYSLMKPMYSQFANFVNFYANKLTGKYKFKVEFVGSNYRWEQEHRLNNLTTLADRGIVLDESVWASAIGMTPMAFEAHMSQAKYGGFADKMMMLMNRNISTENSNSAGRPQEDDSQISESGEMNRNV